MRRRRKGVLLAVVGAGVVFTGLSVALALGLSGDSAEYRGTALLGDPVPPLAFTTFDGDTFDLAAMEGKAVIVNFWNSWCIPCKAEEPALRSFYARHRGESDFAMIGIVRDDSEGAVRKWVREKGTAWPVAMDPGARAAVDFATTGQPETFAISPSGVVVAKHLGEASTDDLENLLALARGGGRAR